MGFLYKAFVRKNTPKLRKKLEELGYNRYPLWMADWSDDDPRYIYLVTDVLYYTYPKEPPKPKNGEHINCGTNEELFLALAALRDDTDEKQWFIMDYGFQKTWVFSETKQFDTNQPFTIKTYKATAEEIIEHFKDK